MQKHFQDEDDCQLRMEAQIVLAPNSKLVILDTVLSVSHPKESLPGHYLLILLSVLLCMKVAGTYNTVHIWDVHTTITIYFILYTTRTSNY